MVRMGAPVRKVDEQRLRHRCRHIITSYILIGRRRAVGRGRIGLCSVRPVVYVKHGKGSPIGKKIPFRHLSVRTQGSLNRIQGIKAYAWGDMR